MTTFCVVGSLNMDFVVPVSQLPHEGETVMGSGYETVPGGKGANQAAAIARLGGSVRMVGKVGQDDFGRTLVQSLGHEGVDISGIGQSPDTRTGCAFILVSQGGSNVIVVAPGANHAWTTGDIRTAQEQASAADVVVLQAEIPARVNVAVAQAARKRGARVIWNPAPARLDRELLSLADILVPNEIEVVQLARTVVQGTTSPQKAARAMLAMGSRAVVVTLGKVGAWLATQAEERHFPGYAVAAIDATAAGDAFVAALAVATSRGAELPEAIRWGNAAGALAATRLGAQPSLPTAQEVLQLLGKG
jgi:ribokinase